MTIAEIYTKFRIPLILQEHMLRVAGIVKYIEDHWTGPNVNWDSLLKAALLHDLGNMVRFKMDSGLNSQGEEEIQKEMVAKYGADDHEATRKMLREVEVDPQIVDWILSKSFANTMEIVAEDVWENKILLYADMRVLPNGIGTMRERLDELKRRRKELLQDQTFEKKIIACQRLETQLQEYLGVSVLTISEDIVPKEKTGFLGTIV